MPKRKCSNTGATGNVACSQKSKRKTDPILDYESSKYLGCFPCKPIAQHLNPTIEIFGSTFNLFGDGKIQNVEPNIARSRQTQATISASPSPNASEQLEFKFKIHGTTFEVPKTFHKVNMDLKSYKLAYFYLTQKISQNVPLTQNDRYCVWLAIGDVLNADFDALLKYVIRYNSMSQKTEKKQEIADLADLFASIMASSISTAPLTNTNMLQNTDQGPKFEPILKAIKACFENSSKIINDQVANENLKSAISAVKKYKNHISRYVSDNTALNDMFMGFLTSINECLQNLQDVKPADVEEQLKNAQSNYNRFLDALSEKKEQQKNLEELTSMMEDLTLSNQPSSKEDFAYSPQASALLASSSFISTETMNYWKNRHQHDFFDVESEIALQKLFDDIDEKFIHAHELNKYRKTFTKEKINYVDLKNKLQNSSLSIDNQQTLLYRMFYYLNIDITPSPNSISGGSKKALSMKQRYPLKQLI